MRSTPPLPDWIRNANIPGYVTAHRVLPDEGRLYRTETLYGELDGTVHLLAKDWGPSSILRQRIEAGDACPYRHAPDMRANKQLRKYADQHRGRGLLYGSALANLLRDDGVVSGSLPNRDAAIAYGSRVLGFVTGRMPRLAWIVCLGQDAWDCACLARGLRGDWRAHRDSGQPLGGLIAAYHPSARVSDVAKARPWMAIERVAA